MAKVKILQSCAGLKFSYGPGDVVEQNEWTDGLINGGLAEWVDKVPEFTEPPKEDVGGELSISQVDLDKVPDLTQAPKADAPIEGESVVEQLTQAPKADAPKKNK